MPEATADASRAEPPPPPLSRVRRHGDVAYVSGQVPLRDGEIVTGSFTEQAQQTLENLRSAVTDAGGSLAGVLKCNCYVRRSEDLAEFNRVYREFFAGVPELPARTTLVADPPNPKVMVEVEAIAAIGP